MLNAIPQHLAVIAFAVSLLSLIAYCLLAVFTIRCSTAPRRGLYLARDIACISSALIWCLLLSLAASGLTFDRLTVLVLRWAMVAVPALSLLLSLLEHEWLLLLPGLPLLLTLPFFETAFGIAFPYVLLAMLALTLFECLFRLVRALRQLPEQLSLSSIQEAIDTLDDGLLFAAEDGSLLLSNRTMGELSSSLCRQTLSNANEFWSALEESVSSDFITKVALEGSFLFRFTGGNTWTFHRESFLLNGKPCTQIVALNVTESDGIQRQIASRQAELSRVALQLQQVEETIDRLKEAEAMVDKGRKAFDSITEKMAALNRFFTEHYALPAETFDYKRLAKLTAGLLQELDHASPLTAPQQLDLTVSALGLIGVLVTVEGSLPEDPETMDAIVHLIREASVNAVLHGNASSVTVTLEETENAFLCRIENDGAVTKEPLSPGGGITSIRRRLFPLGGTLEITKEPVFTLLGKIPMEK